MISNLVRKVIGKKTIGRKSAADKRSSEADLSPSARWWRLREVSTRKAARESGEQGYDSRCSRFRCPLASAHADLHEVGFHGLCAVWCGWLSVGDPSRCLPRGGSLTRGSSLCLVGCMPRFRMRHWRPDMSIRDLRSRGNESCSRPARRSREYGGNSSHFGGGDVLSRISLQTEPRQLEAWPKKSIPPAGATNFRLASPDIVPAARCAHRATHRCACDLTPSITRLTPKRSLRLRQGRASIRWQIMHSRRTDWTSIDGSMG